MSQWPWKPLGEICSTTSGGTPSRSHPEYFGGTIPWIKSGDLTDGDVIACDENITEEAIRSSSAKLFSKGTVLIAMYGATVGKLGMLGIEAATNQAVCGITPSDEVDRWFLFFFLLSQRQNLIGQSAGGAQPNISQKIVRELLVPVPPLPEQLRIVDLLSRAEGIVRLRREAEKKAAELIPALFVDMFGDPATNPRGWPAATLGNVVDEFRYGTSQKSGPTGFPVLRIPNVIGNQLVPSGMKMVEVPKAEADRLRLLDGDFLFVRTNGNPDYVGRSAVYDSSIMQQAGFNGADTLYASYLIRARIQAATLDPYFLQSYLSSTEGRRKLKERCRTSAGQFNINTDGLASIPILIPPMSIQLDFVQRYRDVFSIQSQQSVATATAQATFDALLARCFTLSPSEYCPKAPHPS